MAGGLPGPAGSPAIRIGSGGMDELESTFIAVLLERAWAPRHRRTFLFRRVSLVLVLPGAPGQGRPVRGAWRGAPGQGGLLRNACSATPGIGTPRLAAPGRGPGEGRRASGAGRARDEGEPFRSP
ncbi:hypothetical protein BAU06_21770 [Bordetella bronchialis]|uniref:Uncharacterized protein n=1 Tax=Bordetella bronchialis TaxID=463025 RepID=A0ABN4R5V3_9BORD|nr:hypothetical protein BAU06_21770 [Bordetella bronchialis]